MKQLLIAILIAILALTVGKALLQNGAPSERPEPTGPRATPSEPPETSTDAPAATERIAIENTAEVEAESEQPFAEPATTSVQRSIADLHKAIRELPTWAADDSSIAAKYADFSLAELAEADKLLGPILQEETDPWVADRLNTGDFESYLLNEVTASKGFSPPKQEADGRCLLRILSLQTPEGLKAIRMQFTSDDYPMLDLRLREQNWVTGRLFAAGYPRQIAEGSTTFKLSKDEGGR